MAALQVAGSLAALFWLAPPLGQGLLAWTGEWWRSSLDAAARGGAADLRGGLVSLLWPVGGLLGLLLVIAWLVTVAASMVQTGWRPARRPMSSTPLFRPLGTLRNLLSLQHLWSVVAQALTVALLVAAGFWYARSPDWTGLLQTEAVMPGDWVRQMLSVGCRTGGWISLILLVTSLVDWSIQRRFWYLRQRMTDEEVREEARQDASPQHRHGRVVAGGAAVDGLEAVNAGN